ARADELTNRALALLDLGRTRNAEQALEQARESDPHHPEAAYNLGLLRWRNGQTTDDALVADLAAVDSPRARTLLARVHRERGDHAAARALDGTAPPDGEETDRTVTLEGRWGPASSVGVTPDGRLALAVNRDGLARAWELRTGRRVLSVGHRRHPVLAVCPTTDHRTALIAAGKTVRTWDLDTGRTRRAFRDPGGPVTLVQVTADGHHALTSGVAEQAVRIWELDTGRCVHAFEAHDGQVASVCAVPGTDLVLVAGLTGEDATVRVWDLVADRRVGELPGEVGPVTAVCAAPDGRHAAVASGEPAVRMWDLDRGEHVGELRGHTAPVVSMSVTDDGRHLLTASLDGRVRVWDPADGRCLRTVESDRPMGMFVCAVPGGRQALLPGENGTPRLWRWGTGAAGPFQPCPPPPAADR
ncbi:WD40 repeat domain-containing protein, partial [Thermobifida halotolerans]